MDFSLSDEQAALAETFARFFARECRPGRVRAAEPAGFDAELWKRLCGTDALAVGVPADSGGAGGGLFELTLVCEAQGRAVAPVPMADGAVTARLLARLGGDGAAGLLGGALTGSPLVTLALRPAGPDGLSRVVPAGAAADVVIGLDGDALVACGPPPGGLPPVPANLGAAPLADRHLRGDRAGPRLVLTAGAAADRVFEQARRDWLILTAASLVGVGQGALDLGVAYVKERRQFGVPIGSFQTVAHRLADVATAVDGARFLVQHAAWLADRDLDPSGAVAPMAFAFASEAAQRAAGESLHFHGGYGFMVEYDIQLYYRRAKAWALLWGDHRQVYRAIGAALPEHVRSPGFDRRLGESAAAFRAEAAAFATEHVTPATVEKAYRTGTMHDWDLHRALAARGWLAASWPAEVGGRGRSTFDMLVLLDELTLAGAPLDGWTTTMSATSAVKAKGSQEQRSQVVPAVVRGEALIAIGFSEPDSGSDVAAATTRAVRDGDEWVINGQKMFTTMAHEARWVLLLTRTNLDVPKHRGLTVFLVPLDAPGVEIQPVHTLGWERTNVTFYTDVRVPDSARVGDVDGGWDVILASLTFERGSAFGAASSFLGTVRLVLEEALDWARSTPEGGGDGTAFDDPVTRERLGRAATGYEVARLLAYRSIWVAEQGRLPDVEAAEAKLFATESLQRTCSDLLDMLGPLGLYQFGESGAPAHGELEHAFRHGAVTTIYGGSSEIMRGIIAGRGLGLPRP